MTDNMFDDFESVSSKQWKQKIQVDLKGADYNETLVWHSREDIDVKPFYHADQFDKQPETSDSKATQWKICQEIYVKSVTQANTKTLNVLNRGAESILFVLPTEAVSVYHLLKNIKLSETTIYFRMQFLSENFIKRLNNYLLHKNASVHLNIDLIGNLSRSGNWFHNLKMDHEKLNKVISHFKDFKSVLSVDMSLYQNAGATMVQELAYGIAQANEYLNHINNNENLKSIIKESDLDKPLINFNISVGTNYFFEIAKLRALRKLWKILSAEYGFEKGCNLFVVPSKRNKTIYDYNTNMLRTTTECMSAILGGANIICNFPYDGIYHKDNEFAERIARNQLLVLKHESYFDQVDNPADGTYYMEYLTDRLAEKALKLFKDLEANGGLLKQLKEGTIQRKIKESANKEQVAFDSGEEVLLGTNKHPNEPDKMKDNLELYPFLKTDKRKTLIEPIISNRLAEKLEQQRLKNEI